MKCSEMFSKWLKERGFDRRSFWPVNRMTASTRLSLMHFGLLEILYEWNQTKPKGKCKCIPTHPLIQTKTGVKTPLVLVDFCCCQSFRGRSLIGLKQRCGGAGQMRSVTGRSIRSAEDPTVNRESREADSLHWCLWLDLKQLNKRPEGGLWSWNRVTVFFCGKRKVCLLPRNCWKKCEHVCLFLNTGVLCTCVSHILFLAE